LTTEPKQAALEKLWRQSLSDYKQDGLQERLEAEWKGDKNVLRISEKPPTFQPGYVGKKYFRARVKLVLLLENPGEGRGEEDQRSNVEYLAQLEAFARGEFGFEELNDRIEGHALTWNIYKGKGLFREAPAVRLPLIADDVRHSITEVAWLNSFPFKTRHNADPLKRPGFLEHAWRSFVWPALELLEPAVVARVPRTDIFSRITTPPTIDVRLRALPSPPKVLEVAHPSHRWPIERERKWRKVTDELRRQAHLA
jgi:hypothetical protein